MAGTRWSDEENDIIVRAYLQLLIAELRGDKPVKAAVRRRVEQATGRSKGSVEYKFQNVSAVLREMGMLYLDGYKPMVNFQGSLSSAVERALDTAVWRELTASSVHEIDAAAPRPSTVDFTWTQTLAPHLERSEYHARHRRAMRIDFVAREEANRSLGLAGELAVLARERRRLVQAGRPRLADRVEHVSLERGDGLGFDILSFDPDGREKYIEVKSTRRDIAWPMMVTAHEVDFSREVADQYELHRVYHYTPHSAGIYVLPGEIDRSCTLRPEVMSAVPR